MNREQHDQIARRKALEQHIQTSVSHIYDRMEALLDWMPYNGPAIKPEALTKAQRASIDAVRSLEEEWILDEVDRERMSMIKYQ